MKPERELEVPGFMVIEPVNDRFTAAVDYRNYLLLKSPSRCDEDAEQELYEGAKKIAVLMKDSTISEKTRCR